MQLKRNVTPWLELYLAAVAEQIERILLTASALIVVVVVLPDLLPHQHLQSV